MGPVSKGLWVATVVCGLVGCGGDNGGGESMGMEVGGQCVLKPGSYVVSYEIVDLSEACGDLDPSQDEYITVLNDGTMPDTTPATIDGCVVGNRTRHGCYSSLSIECDLVASGVASGLGGYQIQRLQRGPGDHLAVGEWTGAEGLAVLVDLTPGHEAAGVAEMVPARFRAGLNA